MSKVKVAVYGSLRKGLGNHPLLESSKYLGEEWTGEGYTMISLSAFPGVYKDESGGKIKIEIYEVDSYTAARLDMLEGFSGYDNPNNFYNKELIETSHGPTFIYYINRSGGSNEVVESGDWYEFYMDKKKEYYATKD